MQTPPWSFSSLTKFETCPLQFYHVRVARDIVEPEGEAAKWGSRVHKHLEERVRDGVPLPDEINYLEPVVTRIATTPHDSIHVERRYALDENLTSIDWNSPVAWVRAIVDLELRGRRGVVAFDWKTGKRKPGSDQLMLSAAIIMQESPEINTVATGFLWLKESKVDKEVFHREDLPRIWEGFIMRVERLNNAYAKDRWVAKPSGLCNGWCAVKQCEFWRPKR